MTQRAKRIDIILSQDEKRGLRGKAISKFEFMAFLRQLPDDALIIDARTDMLSGWDTKLSLFVESQEYGVVHGNEVLPHETLESSPARVTHEKMLSVYSFGTKIPINQLPKLESPPSILETPVKTPVCICDFAYTGLTHHKRECPLNPNRKHG